MHYCAITFCIVCFLVFLINIINIGMEGNGKDKYAVGIFVAVLMCLWSILSALLLIFN
jgi:hypothetical protein